MLKGQIRDLGDFKAALLTILRDRLVDQLFGQLGALAGALGGGGKSGIGSILSSGLSFLFGGKSGGRAAGGPVEAGKIYRVNEHLRGSEYFVPSVDGQIYNAAQMEAMMARQAGGGSFAPVFAPVIDARGADGEAVARLRQVVAEQQRQFEAWARDFGGNVMQVVAEAKRGRHPALR